MSLQLSMLCLPKDTDCLLLLMCTLFCTQAYVLPAGPIATMIGTVRKTYLQCGRDP